MMIDRFPFIKKWVLNVAASNGMINRFEPQSIVLEQASQALFADNVLVVDVGLLEEWLGSLSNKDFENLTDGEESEMMAVMSTAPSSLGSEELVSSLLDDVIENFEKAGGQDS